MFCVLMARHVWFLCVRQANWVKQFPSRGLKRIVHEQKQTWNDAESMSCYTKSKYILKANLNTFGPLTFGFN